MAVPGPQCHCLTALHRMYVQDTKGGEDVVLRVHLLWWHHHQVIGPLKKEADQQEPWELVQGFRKGPKKDGEGKHGAGIKTEESRKRGKGAE